MKIENWNFQVAAHSKEMNVAILQRAAELYPDFGSVQEGVQVSWDDQYLQIKPLILDKIVSSGRRD